MPGSLETINDNCTLSDRGSSNHYPSQAAGCVLVTGDKMFLGQAAEQFRLFTGQEADVEVMRGALEGA